MKPAVWAALLLCACTSNFGDREHQFLRYSGLTKTSTALPRLAVLFVLSTASLPCPDLNLIHY
ncbi:putative lipoprotein, partial [Neisseria meningitidis NM115]